MVDNTVLTQIIEIIVSYKKLEKIVIFGSRATNSFRASSDIDIAIFGRSWSSRDIYLVKEALEEKVKTPLKFDVINFYKINKDRLKKDILKDGRIIYEAGKN